MNLQKFFQAFHKKIKVDTEELRDKRNILVDKIRASLKKADRPLPEPLNQGSYIYGVGVVPLGDEEYDIDVGLDFDILSSENSAKAVRDWVYSAIKDHTDKVANRGPCIRVHYAAGYHVDLVVYARHSNSVDIEDYRLAIKDDQWKRAEPKKLKKHVADARKSFENTKDTSGSDQLQRVTRYIKRWNDLEIPGESPDKPFGLATLLLVINHLPQPVLDSEGTSDDLNALIQVIRGANNIIGRISLKKPTQEFEDLFGKLSDGAMDEFKQRLTALLSDLEEANAAADEIGATTILRKQFSDDFPTTLRNAEAILSESGGEDRRILIQDMNEAIPNYSAPSKPWSRN
jgi:hypothetical protein